MGVVVGKAYSLERIRQNRYYADWVKGEEIMEEALQMGGIWDSFG